MPKTNFSPLKHGFHFRNDFINKIISTTFGKMETRGRCGGMAYASLDYYFSGIPIPAHEAKDFPNGKFPDDGNLLADYIYERTINSLFTLHSFKFFDWSLQKDNPKGIRKSVSYKSKMEEFPKLMNSIDKGEPAVIGLISARKASEITHNHQVVVYGYDFDEEKNHITLYTYDSNHPDTEVIIESGCSDCNFRSSIGQEWRGFFLQEYHPKKPKYIDIETKITKEESVNNYSIKNIGIFPSNTKYLDIPEKIKKNTGIILPGEEIKFSHIENQNT